MTLTVYLKKVKMPKFFMHNMPTTEVIGVVNSLNKDHFVFFRNFPFPQGVIV